MQHGENLERAGSETADHHPPAAPGGRYLLLLSLAAVGIVYGDIGTSPIYALRESFLEEHGVAATPANVLGVLSLIFWALVIIVSIKYLTFIMRADNRGEGGILALTSLVTPVRTMRGGRWILISLGLFATGLLYGEGVITPAISVLSAVEGLALVTPAFEPYVLPITVAILVALFAFQRRGTAGVGRVFGPIMVVWFVTLAVLGILNILAEPGVLRAASPHYAIRFLLEHRWNAFLVLGSVVLVVTGAEALYADLGHFGRRPIRLAWFTLVLPALLLNYFGQGALVIGRPEAIENPFFLLVPAWALPGLVVLATAATIIASQALISGAYSLTMQAVQLGYAPRVNIEHTSAEQIGQIYIPGINWAFMLVCIGLVLGFRTSSNIAAAYGVSVTTTMVVTSTLFLVVAREQWRWAPPLALLAGGFFLLVDLSFWSASLLKIPRGGWFSLLAGAAVFTLLTTWKRGREILAQRIRDRTLPRDLFLANILESPPLRVPGTAVYMYSNPQGTPPALLHNLKHNKVLHERVVFLMVETEEVPFVRAEERATVEHLADGIYHVILHYGFMEDVDVPKALAAIRRDGLEFRPLETTYFLGRETLIASRRQPGMAVWREKLFALMSRNARSAASFFRLPPNRVVELGAQIEL
ncbi:MAG TPA: potassium transporter Kup [Longimicrobiales bacterium]